MLSVRLAVALALVATAYSALPPGYEDELYCAKDTCLAPRKMPSGFTGPMTAFHQCVNIVTGHAVGSPRPWGSKFQAGYKEQLLKDGFHTKNCPKSLVIKPNPIHGKDEHLLHEHENKMLKEQERRRSLGHENPLDGEPAYMRAAREQGATSHDSFAEKAEVIKNRQRPATTPKKAGSEEEISRAEHEKQHAERMEDLKEKHPEHYDRMMKRKQQLEGEKEETLRSRMEEKKAARKAGGPKVEPMHIMRGPKDKKAKDNKMAEM